MASHAADHGGCGGIAGGGSREHLFGRADAAAPSDGRTRDERLQAAAQPAGTGRTCGIGDDMADLSGKPARAAHDAAIDDDPGRDARPQGEVGQAGCLAPVVRRVVAVDESGAMLGAARKRLANFENVDVRTGSLESLPIENGELDVALLFMVTHFLLEPVKVLSEVRRVLSPGGRVVVMDLTTHEREEYSLQMGHVWQGIAEEQIRSWATDGGLAVARYRVLPTDPLAKGPAVFTMVAQKAKR